MTEKQFNRKIESVKEPLRRFLLGLCGGDSFTADDLAQDTLLKLLMSSATRRIGIRFKAWVFKTAFNVWLDNRYTRRCVSLDEMSYDVSDDGYAENCMVRNMDNYSELYLAIDGCFSIFASVFQAFLCDGYAFVLCRFPSLFHAASS